MPARFDPLDRRALEQARALAARGAGEAQAGTVRIGLAVPVRSDRACSGDPGQRGRAPRRRATCRADRRLSGAETRLGAAGPSRPGWRNRSSRVWPARTGCRARRVYESTRASLAGSAARRDGRDGRRSAAPARQNRCRAPASAARYSPPCCRGRSRADSTRPTRNPALANIHAVETPVIPPPTTATSTDSVWARGGKPRDFGSRSSQSGGPRRSRGMLANSGDTFASGQAVARIDGSGEGRTLLIGRTMKQQIAPKPYWTDSAALPAFPKLERDEDVDVVVVGAGITGLTAAYLLTKAGRTVAVLDRNDPVQGDTGLHQRAPHDGDRRVAQRARRPVRPRPRAGRLGRGPGRDRPDRRHRAGRGHRVRFCVGARLSSQPAWRSHWESLEKTTRRRSATKRRWPGSWDSTRPISTTPRSPAVRESGSRIRRAFIRGSIWPASRAQSRRQAGTSTGAARPRSSRISRCRSRRTVTRLAAAISCWRRTTLSWAIPGWRARRSSRPSWLSTPPTSSPGARRRGRCPMRCSGTPRIPTTTCGLSRRRTTISSSLAARITRPARPTTRTRVMNGSNGR